MAVNYLFQLDVETKTEFIFALQVQDLKYSV